MMVKDSNAKKHLQIDDWHHLYHMVVGIQILDWAYKNKFKLVKQIK